MSDHLLPTARHTAAQLRTAATELAAFEDPASRAMATRIAALAGGLEAEIARAAAPTYEAHSPPPVRSTGATPALVGAARLHREGVR